MERAQSAQIALDHGEFDQTKIVQGQLLIPRSDGATLLEPADATFDHAAPAIANRIVADWTSTPTTRARPFGRDHRTDAVPPQPEANATRVIGAVATQMAWTPTRTTTLASDVHTLDNRLKLG